MKISELIELLTNRVYSLEQQKENATQRGDVSSLVALDIELDETRNTLATLRSSV